MKNFKIQLMVTGFKKLFIKLVSVKVEPFSLSNFRLNFFSNKRGPWVFYQNLTERSSCVFLILSVKKGPFETKICSALVKDFLKHARENLHFGSLEAPN